MFRPTTNYIILKFQHGFQSGRSCEIQLNGAINEWANTIAKEDHIDLIILDLSKTFDHA